MKSELLTLGLSMLGAQHQVVIRQDAPTPFLHMAECSACGSVYSVMAKAMHVCLPNPKKPHPLDILTPDIATLIMRELWLLRRELVSDSK